MCVFHEKMAIQWPCGKVRARQLCVKVRLFFLKQETAILRAEK